MRIYSVFADKTSPSLVVAGIVLKVFWALIGYMTSNGLG